MLPFRLPPPAGHRTDAIWNGSEFVIGETTTPVLEYSENFEGWSDDLTNLHEEAAGANHPIDVASRRRAIREIQRYGARQDAVIMDIGCSSGFLLKEIAQTFPQSSVVGADVVKEPLLRLSKELPNVPLIRFDLLQCPLPPQSIDVIVMLNVLEHIGDDVLAMKRAYELLKPGGLLVVEVPAGPFLFGPYDVELHHFRRYTCRELERKLRSVGFKIASKSHLGFLLFPMFALVKLKDKYIGSKASKDVVKQQAASTKESRLLNILTKIETKYLSGMSLPFGVRVTSTAIK